MGEKGAWGRKSISCVLLPLLLLLTQSPRTMSPGGILSNCRRLTLDTLSRKSQHANGKFSSLGLVSLTE
jgi:hypothetical protein